MCVKLLYMKQLMVLKMATSWSNMSLMSFIQCTRVWPPWLHLKKWPFCGQPSLPHGQPVITVTVTVWHLPNLMSQPSLLSCQHIPSIAYLLIFFHYKGNSYHVVVGRYSLNRHQQSHIWNIWDSRWVYKGRWSSVHCSRHMSIPQGLLSQTAEQKLASKQCQMTHHQQQRPTWPSKYPCSTTFWHSHTPISEHP